MSKTDVPKASTFLISKIHLPAKSWRAPSHADIIEFQTFFRQLKNQKSGFSAFLDLKGVITLLKLTSPSFFNKKVNFSNNEPESKMENPTHAIRETSLELQFT